MKPRLVSGFTEETTEETPEIGQSPSVLLSAQYSTCGSNTLSFSKGIGTLCSVMLGLEVKLLRFYTEDSIFPMLAVKTVIAIFF